MVVALSTKTQRHSVEVVLISSLVFNFLLSCNKLLDMHRVSFMHICPCEYKLAASCLCRAGF